MRARWMRLGETDALDFDEACGRLALAQPAGASPLVLWGETADVFPFALIAPLRLVPGRRRRAAWGLAPAVAAYRQFGVPAYLDGDELWLHGRRIADSVAETVGECLVVASSFVARFPGKCVATPSSALEHAFRTRLEAQHGWQFEHAWPAALDLALA